jgi:hypothetical protein
MMTKRRALRVFLVAGVLCGLCGPRSDAATSGQEPSVTAASRVDKSRITIGDLIQYTVTVSHPKDIAVATPGTGANLGGFEVRAYNVPEPKEKDGLVVSEFHYTISTFLTGEFTIPPLPVAFRPASDSLAAPRVIATPSIRIVVESMKPSEAGDIRDVKPPLAIPLDWKQLALRIGAGLLALAALIAGVVLVRRWKSGKGLLPVRTEPPRPPHEIALEALGRLTASDLLAKGGFMAFTVELTEIVRRYIGGRYFVVAMEMTTTEVLDGLAGAGIEGEVFGLFETFFHGCDLVKFAKHVPSDGETDGSVRTAYEIVNRTKIVLEPAKAEDAAETPPGGASGVENAEGDTSPAPQAGNGAAAASRPDRTES